LQRMGLNIKGLARRCDEPQRIEYGLGHEILERGLE
jgi:hypothetical protein